MSCETCADPTDDHGLDRLAADAERHALLLRCPGCGTLDELFPEERVPAREPTPAEARTRHPDGTGILAAMTTLFLSSLESTRLAPVRACRFGREVHFDTGKVAVVAELDPPLAGQDLGVADDVATVVLTDRHEGSAVTAIERFPCFVHVAVPRPATAAVPDVVRGEDLVVIGWGELYRSADDAARHRFDRGPT